MSSQVSQDADVHRQHVRLKVPIRVEMDGARYRVEDWSVGGFALENVSTSRQPGERCRVRVGFPFDGFEVSTRVDALVVDVDRDHQRFACRFLMLTTEQLDLFHYVADAYLSGEVVTVGELIHVRANGATARAPDEAPRAPTERDRGPPSGRRVRRYVVPAVGGLAAALLLGFGAIDLGDRLLTVTAASAVVDAPLQRLHAPIAGPFTTATGPGQRVERGAPLAVVRGADDTVVPLESPCTCVVLHRPDAAGRVYQPGATLMTLVAADAVPRVRAEVTPDDVARLRPGGRATIRFPDRGLVLRGEIERIDLVPARAGLSADAAPIPIDRRLAQVLIRPDRRLAVDDVGTLVSVRFR